MKNIFYTLSLLGTVLFSNNLFGQTYDVVWTDLVGVTASGNTITKTAPNGWGNGGAASENVLPAGQDGWVEFIVQKSGDNFLVGLSSVNTDASYNTVNYAIQQYSSNRMYQLENGPYVGPLGATALSVGDVLRVERIGNTIYYKHNGNVKYTSTVPSTTQLIVDVAINSSGTKVVATTSFPVPGTTPPPTPVITEWQLNNNDIFYDAGNVAIGDSTATGKLRVVTDSTAWSGIVIDHNVTSDSTFGLKINVPGSADKAFAITKNDTTQFQVNGDGKAFAREVEVTLNPFPDYVFEEKYPLMPLSQLKVFIQQNRHLPNIPPASEVDALGIGLGDLSHRQMEKIEELTLYLIQLNDRMERLESENAQLRAEIQKLKKRKKH